MTLENRVTPVERLKALSQCITTKGHARILEAHSGLSGIVAENARVQKDGQVIEYDGIWESSLTDSGTKGLPDASIVGPDSRAHTIDEILNVTNKPIIVDGDTGGDTIQFEYLVKRLERLGVSAVVVEDKVYPKRSSLDSSDSQKLEDPAVFAEKIEAGKAVAISDDFMIIARLESLITGAGLRDDVERAERYIQAGADGIMIHSYKRGSDEVLAFAEIYEGICQRLGRRPILVSVPTTYNSITDADLAAHGFDIIIHANHLLRAAYKAMVEAASTILASGRSLEADSSIAAVPEIFSCVGLDRISRRDRERSQAPRIAERVGDPAALTQGHRR